MSPPSALSREPGCPSPPNKAHIPPEPPVCHCRARGHWTLSLEETGPKLHQLQFPEASGPLLSHAWPGAHPEVQQGGTVHGGSLLTSVAGDTGSFVPLGHRPPSPPHTYPGQGRDHSDVTVRTGGRGAPIGGSHPSHHLLPGSGSWRECGQTRQACPLQPQRGRGHVTPKMSPSQGDPDPSGDGSKVSLQGPPGPEKVQMSQPGCCLGHGHPGFPPGAELQGQGLPSPILSAKAPRLQPVGRGWARPGDVGPQKPVPVSYPPPTKATGCPGSAGQLRETSRKAGPPQGS